LKFQACLESGPAENEDKFQVRPEFLKGEKFKADPNFQTDAIPEFRTVSKIRCFD
jgi:hypothetical protein